MAIKRAHIVIPEDLVQSIDALVGKRKRSKFITGAAKKELSREPFGMVVKNDKKHG